MALLREYHAAIGEIIIRYSGTLERYAGDGVMVVFNDPIPSITLRSRLALSDDDEFCWTPNVAADFTIRSRGKTIKIQSTMAYAARPVHVRLER